MLFLVCFLNQHILSKTTLYYNGHIFTSDTAQPLINYFVVQNGKIIKIGKPDLDDSSSKIDHHVNLNGQTVIPGFLGLTCGIFITYILLNLYLPPAFRQEAAMATRPIYSGIRWVVRKDYGVFTPTGAGAIISTRPRLNSDFRCIDVSPAYVLQMRET